MPDDLTVSFCKAAKYPLWAPLNSICFHISTSCSLSFLDGAASAGGEGGRGRGKEGREGPSARRLGKCLPLVQGSRFSKSISGFAFQEGPGREERKEANLFEVVGGRIESDRPREPQEGPFTLQSDLIHTASPEMDTPQKVCVHFRERACGSHYQ